MQNYYWEVSIPGFLGEHVREFTLYGQALTWVRQVGREREAIIKMVITC